MNAFSLPGTRSIGRGLLGLLILLSAAAVLNFSITDNRVTTQPGGYFAGRLGTTGSVRLFLALDGTNVSGSCSVAVSPVSAQLTGGVDAQGTMVLTASGWERGNEGTSGVFTARFEGHPPGFRGHWLGLHQTIAIPVELPRVAQGRHFRHQVGFALGRFGGTKRVAASFPSFDSPDEFHRAINRLVSEVCITAAESFTSGSASHIADGIRMPSASWNWEAQSSIEMIHDSPHVVSLHKIDYEYTGGAHGNHADSGLNFVADHGRAKPFALPELFAAGTDWEAQLARHCLRDLRQQDASSVVNGTIQQFTAAELSVFTVSPAGIQIYFAPYAVGCYAEGAFAVQVPWREVRACLRKDGPGQFLDTAP